jgi:hypothetical protein
MNKKDPSDNAPQNSRAPHTSFGGYLEILPLPPELVMSHSDAVDTLTIPDVKKNFKTPEEFIAHIGGIRQMCYSYLFAPITAAGDPRTEMPKMFETARELYTAMAKIDMATFALDQFANFFQAFWSPNADPKMFAERMGKIIRDELSRPQVTADEAEDTIKFLAAFHRKMNAAIQADLAEKE